MIPSLRARAICKRSQYEDELKKSRDEHTENGQDLKQYRVIFIRNLSTAIKPVNSMVKYKILEFCAAYVHLLNIIDSFSTQNLSTSKRTDRIHSVELENKMFCNVFVILLNVSS